LEVLKNFLNVFCVKKLLRTPNPELQTCGVTRRHFLRCLMALPFLSSFPFRVRETWADLSTLPKNERERSIGEFFKGEEFEYEIGVWLFKRVALGKLTFRETERKGQYMAIAQAETLGVLGWLARYRVDTYRSVMEEIEGGRRLRSLSFEEDVKIGNRLRRKTHLFDYQKRKWIQMRRAKSGATERTEEAIPAGMIYDDFLTASYNFRYGVYGEIERGRRYTVPTFPRKGATSYEVRVAAEREEEKRRKSERFKDGKEYYLTLLMDPEVTHSKEGIVEGWLSRELYPVEGRIKDVILFGDVKGTLIKSSKLKAEG